MAKLIKNSKTTTFSSSYHFYHHFYIFLFNSKLLQSTSSSPTQYSLLGTPRKPPTTTHYPNLCLLFFLLFLISSLLLAISEFPSLPFTEHSKNCSPTAPLNYTNEAISLSEITMVPLPVHKIPSNLTLEEQEFWKQPDDMGYRPCIEFSIEYRKASVRIAAERRRFLVAFVSGGLNQQRNQIVDAVVIARILGAALVLPVLKVNVVWGDESEFSDIFDEVHFKRTLRSDVRIVSCLPSTHLMIKNPTIHGKIPFGVSPFWIRSRFFKQLNSEGVLMLKGLDSKLSKNLPLDLQKLRCKVAFHALRFVAPIRELGGKITRKMWTGGPYVAIHLRLEKDVWVRTGCLPGLGPEDDDVVSQARESHPELLTGRLNMTHNRRRLAGLCPLNALEVTRLLKALGAPRSTRIYIAGGEPLGGEGALRPLLAEYPNLFRKELLDSDGELSQFINRASILAAIDYLVALSSDVFLPSHGGNMGRALQGHRAYEGHRKYIKPNKRALIKLLGNESIVDAELGAAVRRLHRNLLGQPELRTKRSRGDVIAYPVPECMCRSRSPIF